MSDGRPFDAAREIIRAGIASRAFPASAIDVGHTRGSIWSEAFGQLTYAPDAPACTAATLFDLASLTKVIATASLAMRAVQDGRLQLDTRVRDVLPSWTALDRAVVTIRQLLDHSSGLPAHARLFETAHGRPEFERAIAQIALDYAPGRRALYSDLGFIVLGFILADRGPDPLHPALDAQFADFARAFDTHIGYHPPPNLHDAIAPTEDDAWRGRVIQGEVHDENAAALGGVAGHAGLFGTAAAVGAFARLVLTTFTRRTALGTPAFLQTFVARSSVPGSSRALGWDTMLPTSSCGRRMSARAIGHTGFTGVSLWIDPEQDAYVVWLTNRVHPTRADNTLHALRPALHDAVMEQIGRP
jgi:CubicO group peptidase (beta-lactamase class C family)